MFADFTHIVKLMLLFVTGKKIALHSNQMQNRRILTCGLFWSVLYVHGRYTAGVEVAAPCSPSSPST